VHRVMQRGAEDIRFGAKLGTACHEDRLNFCSSVQPGSARVIRCLQSKCVLLSTWQWMCWTQEAELVSKQRRNGLFCVVLLCQVVFLHACARGVVCPSALQNPLLVLFLPCCRRDKLSSGCKAAVVQHCG